MKNHRPFLSLVISFGLGILIQEYVLINWMITFVGFIGLVGLNLIFIKIKWISHFLILLSIVFLGMMHTHVYKNLPVDYYGYIIDDENRKSIVVEGVIVSDSEIRPKRSSKKTTFVLEVQRLKVNNVWHERKGKVLVNIFRSVDLNYGDVIVLQGNLHKPFNFSDSSFSYPDYLKRKSIRYILSVKKDAEIKVLRSGQGQLIKSLSIKVKNHCSSIIEKHFSKIEAGMLQGIILGDRYNIPSHIYELFKITGTAHIIAISGFNVGIVVYLIWIFLKILPISRQWRYVFTIIAIIFYAFLTGGQPPVVRATIMAVVFLMSFLLEREADLLNSLSLSALVILYWNPQNLFDVGFQLSFVSVLTIILFYPTLTKYFLAHCRTKDTIISKLFNYFIQSMCLSLTACIGVSGLVAYYFHMITPVVFLSNLIVIPIVSLIVILAMIFLPLVICLPWVAASFVICLKLLLNLMVGSIFVCAQIPWGYFYLSDFSVTALIIYYAAVLLLVVWMAWKKDRLIDNDYRL